MRSLPIWRAPAEGAPARPAPANSSARARRTRTAHRARRSVTGKVVGFAEAGDQVAVRRPQLLQVGPQVVDRLLQGGQAVGPGRRAVIFGLVVVSGESLGQVAAEEVGPAALLLTGP